MAFPLRVIETSGALREVVLRGRALPYQGATWEGDQRVPISWMPGNPTGVAQVLGATYKPTTFSGKWKDRFLSNIPGASGSSGPALISNFPPLGPALASEFGDRAAPTFVSGGPAGTSVPSEILGVPATKARVLRDCFEAIRLGGQLLRVQWGSITRYGFLSNASFAHDREEDIAFELEFSWIGETSGQPEIKERAEDRLNFLQFIRSVLQKLSNLLNQAFALLQRAALALKAVQQLIRKVSSLVSSLVDVYRKLAELIFFPFELIQEARSLLTEIRQTIQDLKGELGFVPAAYSNGLDPVEKNIATGIAQAILAAAKELGVEVILQFIGLGAAASPDLLGTVIADGSATLRDLSTQFYKTPNNWTKIADYNDLPTSLPARGTIVYIPVL